MSQARIGIIIGVATLLTVLFALPAFALDPPHGSEISCRNCHDALASNPSTGGLIDNTPINQVCTGCHSTPGGKTAKVTHSSTTTSSDAKYGPWSTDCVDCHDPHYQDQLWAFPGIYNGGPGSGSYLETGTVTSVSGGNLVLNVNFANAGGWPVDQWVKYKLVPDITDFVAYNVVSSTGTSLTTQLELDTYIVKAGDTFALVQTRLVRDEIRTLGPVTNSTGQVYNTNAWRPVKFFNTTGYGSAASSLTDQRAVCVVCHTRTEYFNMGYAEEGQGFDNVVADYYNTWHANNNSGGATTCWSNTNSCHKEPVAGFDANCEGCHGQPPVVANVITRSLINNPWYTGKTVGAHETHFNKGIEDCYNCHQGGGDDDPEHMTGDQITMGFKNVLGGTGTFKDNIAFANAPLWTIEAGNGQTAIQISGGPAERTCTSIYCHSDGATLTGASPAIPDPDWDAAQGSLNCNSCHSSPMTADAHSAHAWNGGNNYNFDCFECHANTVNQGNNTNVPAAKQVYHVNTQKDIAWGNVASGSPAYSPTTCATVYCHNAGGTAQVTPDWNGSLPGDCSGCHDTARVAVTNLSGSHSAHTATGGSNLGCVECHSGTVSANTVISDYSLHVNGTKNIDAAHTYTTSCATSTCHGPQGSPVWGTDLSAIDDCTKCHGEQTASPTDAQIAPGGAGTDLDGKISAADTNVGAHQAHLTTPSNYTADIACNNCHIKPTAVGDAGHFDTARPAELTFSPFANNIGNLVSAYNPVTGACSNTYCHGNLMPAGSSPGVGNTPIWNDTSYLSGSPSLAGDCSQCHNAPPLELATYHNAGLTFSDCDTCHQHLNDDGSFANTLLHMDGIVQALACEACHGQPPFNEATMINTNADLEQTGRTDTFGATAWGKHVYHNLTKGYDCMTCHNGGGSEGQHNNASPPGYITIGFNINGILGGVYNAPDFSNSNYDIGTGPSTTYNMGGSTRTCSSIYCHSDGGDFVNTYTYAAPNWDEADFTYPADCNKCHGDVSNYVITERHDKHVGSYDFDCVNCHADTVDANAGEPEIPAGKIANHVNRQKDVKFSGALATGADYSTKPNCTSTFYCHSDAKGGAPNNTPAWDNAGSLPSDCTGCHNNDASTAMMTTGTHPSHINNADYVGKELECWNCHAGTMDIASDQAIGTGKFANHVDGTIQNLVGLDGTTCNNISCHSSGNYEPGALITYNNQTWGGGADLKCWDCHGNGVDQPAPISYPDGNEGLPNANSHEAHVVSANLNCKECHQYTTASSTMIDGIDPTKHVNNQVDIKMAQGGTFTAATETCSATYCHGGAALNWGQSVAFDCESCHKSSQALSGKHSLHYNSPPPADSSNPVNLSNATNYRFNCGTCHDVNALQEHADGSNAGAEVANGYTVDIKFNLSNWSASGGSYDKGPGTFAVGNYTYWTQGQCSSIYCHSDGKATPIVYNTVSWAGAPQGCGSCHDKPGETAAITNLSGAHGRHMGSDTYSFACGECHSETVLDNTSGPISNKAVHVDGIRNVVFGSAGPVDQSGGSFSAGSCSTVYCHSDGQDTPLAYANPAWSGSISDCTSCHDNNAPATALSDAHPKHVASDQVNYTCDHCHTETVQDNQRTILAAGAMGGVHVDGVQNVVFSTTGLPADNYNFQADGASYNDGPKTCSNVYCHSTVQESNATAPGAYNTPDWDDSLTAQCGECHKGDGVQGNTSKVMDTGSHQKHVQFEGFQCWYCHDGGGPDNPANHADGRIQVVLNSLIGGIYNQGPADTPGSGYGSCSSVYCHNVLTPKWFVDNGKLNCYDCHSANNTLPGRHNTHYATATNSTSRNGGNDSTTTEYAYNCGVCHPQFQHARLANVPNHSTADVVFNTNIAGTGATFTVGVTNYPDGATFKYTNSTCSTYCHSDGTSLSGPFTPNNSSFNWNSLVSTLDCEGCHSGNASATNKMASGSHTRHMNDLAGVGLTYECATCHDATVSDGEDAAITGKDFHVNTTNDVVFNSLNSGGSFAQGADTCSSTYCHSTVQTVPSLSSTTSAGVSNTPTWGNAADGQCGACHNADGVQGNLSKMRSGSHQKHVVENDFQCWYCHDGGGPGSVGNHVDGLIQVILNSEIGGTYSQGANPPNNDTGTCSAVYCHNAASPIWSLDNNTFTCGDCHKSNNELLGRHDTHFDSLTNATMRTGGNNSTSGNYIYNCGVCHPSDQHAKLPVTVDFQTANVAFNTSIAGAGASHTAGVSNFPDGTFDFTDATCSTYCHSDGTSLTGPYTPNNGLFNWASPTSTLDCTGCHTGSAAYASVALSGKHDMHMATDRYSYNCGECHAATVNDDTNGPITGHDYHVNVVNDVVFASINGIDQSLGSFSSGQCSATYCHSNAQGGSVATPLWASGSTGCSSCHQNNESSTTLSAAHPKHAAADQQNYTCDNCHAETVADDQIITLAGGGYGVHVDGVKNIVFSGTAFLDDIRDLTVNSAGYTIGTKTCSNVYCHSSVQAEGGLAAGAFNSPTWNGSVVCGNCHRSDGVQGIGDLMGTGSHNKHLSPPLNFNCMDCHFAGGAANLGNHVDGMITVNFNSPWGGSYTGGIEQAPENGYSTCTSVYCHSSGSNATGGSPPAYATPSWGSPVTAECGTCHKADGLQGDASIMTSGAHDKHLSVGQIFICDDCHNGEGPPNSANHVDTFVQLSFLASNAGASASYANTGQPAGNGAYGACTSVYCHGNFNGGGVALPVWDGTAACGTCHSATPSSNAHTAHITTVGLSCTDCHGHEGPNTHIDMVANGILNTAAWFFNGTSQYDGQGSVWSSGKADSSSVGSCSTVECHSMVQPDLGFGNPVYNAPAWDGTVICGNCHKSDNVQGDLSEMDTGTHNKHLTGGAALACGECHATGGESQPANHANNQINVANATNIVGGYDQATGPAGNGYGTCTNITCHGGNNAVWGGGALNCSDCHGTAGVDVDDFEYGNGTAALVSTGTDWTVRGHGAATGDLPLACLDCHDSGISHGDSANPFRLKTWDHTDFQSPNLDANNGNSLCLTCHATGALGMYPGPTPPNLNAGTASGAVDKYHQMTKHTESSRNGGRFCWDCHDPHGDNANLAMIQNRTSMVTTGDWGNPGALSNLSDGSNPVVFIINTNPTTPNGFARVATQSDYTASQGLCNSCHEQSVSSPSMENYFMDGSDGNTDGQHNNLSICTGCHGHNVNTNVDGNAWQGIGGGNCMACHNTTRGSSPVRRAVVGGTPGGAGDDFKRGSGHAQGAGGSEVVNNMDCTVCHAEGDYTATIGSPGTNSARHGGDGGTTTVDLRNVDSRDVYYAWDRTAPNTTMRDGMDMFCMRCHDADGASDVSVAGDDVSIALGAGPDMTPFNSSTILDFSDSFGRTGVIDVWGAFNYTNAVGSNWASHHNLNQFTRRYDTADGTITSGGSPAGGINSTAWTGYTTLEGASLDETAGLHCADCHLNETNAHGTRNSIYMLKDSSGADAAFATTGLDTDTHTCFLCHTNTDYALDASTTGSRLLHAQQDSNSHLPQQNNYGVSDVNGIMCLNCHGGYKPGSIHGSNEDHPILDSTTATTKRYRFISGAAGKFFYPTSGAFDNMSSSNVLDWEGTRGDSYACYTTGAADTYSNCTKHVGGTDADGKGYKLRYQRLLDY